MPADSTLDSAPENASQQPAAEPSEAPLAPSSTKRGLPETGALGESDGVSIAHIPDGWEQSDTAPGPENVVIPRLVSWAQQFETESVRYVVGRFNEQEQAVPRVLAKNSPMPRTKAPTLVQQDAAQTEHNRRKLKSVAKEWRRLENNCRELP